MSLYDKSSLVMIPSGKKDGTVFSQKPVDGTGDFTFSRGSNLAATRVGPTGLIEKGRENLLLYSNQFDTTWVKAASATLTSGQSGYNGSSDAWLLTKGNLYSNIYQNLSQGNVCTFSFYAKANTYSWLMLHIEDSAGDAIVSFNLNDGSIGGQIKNISASTESLGNGWYRCSITALKNATQFRIYPNETDWYSGASGSIYIQDAQLEIGLAATDYIESGASTGKAGLLENEPRFDYSGGATCPSLLLEPSRTNLVTQSEYFGSGWTLSNITANYNNSTSPEGLQNATNLVPNTSNGGHRMYLSFTASGDVTASIYVKPNGYSKIGIQNNAPGGGQYFTFDIDTLSKLDGNETDYGYETAANGFIRLWVVMPAGTTEFGYFLYVLNDSYTTGNPGLYTFAGDGTSGISVYGAQAEQASYPTSYIPNHSGGTITRSVDVSSVSSMISNGIINDERFTFMTHLKILGRATNPQVYLTDVSGNRIVSLNTQALNKASFYSPDAANYIGNGTFIGDSVKVAISYDGNKFVQYINGAKDGILSINITSVMNGINLNNNILNAIDVKQVLVFPTALTDQEAIDLTTI